MTDRCNGGGCASCGDRALNGESACAGCAERGCNFSSADNNGVLIGIIGGFGGMGSLFRGVFERAGIEVICSGINTFYSNRYLAAKCDIVIVSVPIHETIKVIEEIAPIMNKNQLLCDFTSIKTAPVEAMLKSEAQVMGLHPMFGPSVASIKGQTIVASPVRCRDSDKKLLFDIFENEGASVCIMTPQEHDRVMGIVQGLVHFATLSVAEAVRNTLESAKSSGDSLTLDTVISVMSPVYRIEMGLIGRILGQDAGLYGDILKMNPAVVPVIEEMSSAVSRLKAIVEDSSNKSFEDFDEFFRTDRETFSSYIPQATADTDKLIVAMTKEETVKTHETDEENDTDENNEMGEKCENNKKGTGVTNDAEGRP